MLKIIKKLSGRVLGGMAIKERTVYVDPSLPTPRRRFTTAHELGHDALRGTRPPTSRTITRPCRHPHASSWSAKRNLYAAELLFGLDRFTEEADRFAPSLGVAMQLGPPTKCLLTRRCAATPPRVATTSGVGHHGGLQGQSWRCAEGLSRSECVVTRFRARYGEVTDLLGNTVTIEGNEAMTTLAAMTRGVHEEAIDLALDTRRGTTRFQAHLFYNGRFGSCSSLAKRCLEDAFAP